MHSVPYAKETLVMLLGYALGCFTSGYYLVRWRTGDDIRWLGSGSVGAPTVPLDEQDPVLASRLGWRFWRARDARV